MTTPQMQSWYYFLSIERDFIRTTNFVEVSSENDDTFSNEFAKLLLLIGSEVDVVAKMLCAKIAPGTTAKNIDDYRKIITGAFSGIETIEIEISRYGRTERPWASWAPAIGSSPDWWRAHNHVKHQRDTNFPDANLKSTIAALSGLLTLLLYLLKDERHLQPYPDLLEYAFPSYMVSSGGKKLPGT